jgi:GNAT superfamily N-acetyltransferase
VEIVKAVESDSAAIAQILVSSWRAAYKGIMPGEMLDNLSVKQREESWKKQLASGGEAYLIRVSGEVAGVVEICPFRDTIDGFVGCGEIPVIYLIPEKYGIGLGSKLIEFAMAVLLRRGISEVCIWVLEKNERAVAFYKKHGFSFCGQTKVHNPTGLVEQLFIKNLWQIVPPELGFVAARQHE